MTEMKNVVADPRFPDFAALSAYLDGLGLFRMTPGLERIAAMLDRLGLRRPPYTVAQIVGTNGKGSVSAMLAALGKAHGLRVGLHMSPHFLSVRERVRVDGAMLTESAWTALGNALMNAGGEELSYFEFVTALAVLSFAEAGVDLAVMETGLGGAFDATTALEADLVAFTPLGLDHQAVLGPTLRDIAADKAGAIRPGRPAFSVPQPREAWAELTRVAEERQTTLREVPPSYPLPLQGGSAGSAFLDVPPPPVGSGPVPALGLAGLHQYGNARLALAVWRALRKDGPLSSAAREKLSAALAAAPEEDLEARALAGTRLPGRFQYVPPFPRPVLHGAGPVPDNGIYRGPEQSESLPEGGDFFPCSLGWPPLLLDGAHNGHGLAALGQSLGRAGIAPAAVIFSCLADKDLEDMIPLLRALATGPVFVPPIQNNPRAAEPRELAAAIGLNAVPAASLAGALEQAATHMAQRLPEAFAGARPRNPLLICGSLYLLGEFYALRPDCLEFRAAPL